MKKIAQYGKTALDSCFSRVLDKCSGEVSRHFFLGRHLYLREEKHAQIINLVVVHTSFKSLLKAQFWCHASCLSCMFIIKCGEKVRVGGPHKYISIALKPQLTQISGHLTDWLTTYRPTNQ